MTAMRRGRDWRRKGGGGDDGDDGSGKGEAEGKGRRRRKGRGRHGSAIEGEGAAMDLGKGRQRGKGGGGGGGRGRGRWRFSNRGEERAATRGAGGNGRGGCALWRWIAGSGRRAVAWRQRGRKGLGGGCFFSKHSAQTKLRTLITEYLLCSSSLFELRTEIEGKRLRNRGGMDSNAREGFDSKAEFRKPSNDAANRKYRRRSPVGGSSSSSDVNRNLVGTGYMSTDQKKKLLWGNKKKTAVEESAHRWDTTMFGDRERQEKFNKLMGVKGDAKMEQKPDNPDVEKQREQLQMELEKQYTAGLRRRDGRTVGLGL
ncbi:UNVERIFIED_CONTAM: hypothetical protein Slati_1300200 [Sesamum latifolium]|uniref:Small acidic protein-like domain-containing protein n=1 Tax=Sesamum latifolium TaxID=2727402 RepID=A0AAW2XLT3_9LAMI